MILSILTATYNRAKYLNRLYNSIMVNQICGCIEAEWIIIDDGSTDNTKDVVERFIKGKKVSIKYLHQRNSGKMAAINMGIQFATGDLIVDCDSDDYFTDNAFEIIGNNYSKMLKNENIYAICFLKQDLNGNISGERFKENYMQTTMFDLYFKNDVGGEKILVFNSKIRKKYKHELEDGEKFVTEDEKYSIICINEVIEIGKYIDDGYNKNIFKTYKNSPKGYNMYFREIMQKDLKNVNLKKKTYILKNYIYFKLSCFEKNIKRTIKNNEKIIKK